MSVYVCVCDCVCFTMCGGQKKLDGFDLFPVNYAILGSNSGPQDCVTRTFIYCSASLDLLLLRMVNRSVMLTNHVEMVTYLCLSLHI